ncbi:hypothetical protein FPOAC2_05847 [Fusarium poae]|uniref:Uncharacterized protein n=1 Tax=Fusarium poae TaxID=36050 RepID=A0A1B8AVZ5_FUSPO|nr:hypothetical protein FPOAC1_005729 [Fusarium poae]KAG8672457.1 hypothetical protein FPOAC1_005729 [Fusarium poae]OBS24662.1 hypothetical protein FPOA_05202 [Fusarium poae]
MSSQNLYVATCKDRGTGGARHWILIMAEEGYLQATWYHSTGGPTQGKPYSAVIENKRFRSHGIEKCDFIGQISSKDKNKIKSAAQRTPARFCQRWVVNVLGALEKRGIVPEGTWSDWLAAMEVDPYSEDGAPVCESSSDDDGSDFSSINSSFSEDFKN